MLALTLEQVCDWVVGGGQEKLTLVSGIGEDSFWDTTMVVVAVEEVFRCIRMWWDNKEVEVIVNLLLFGLPIVIVEVVIDPHESLVDHFRNN